MKTSLADAQILEAVERVVGNGPRGLHEPDIGERELSYAADCLSSGYVSSFGEYVERFEKKISEVVHSEKVLVTVNGTSALHLALMAVGVKPGDEVLVPSLTFVATVNAVSYCQAVPNFVDIERTSWGIDPESFEAYLEATCEITPGGAKNRETGRTVRAVVVVHLLGFPAQVVEICRIAKRFGLAVVEDAAGAIGSRVQGQHVGTFGDVGILSFNGNKTVTAGGGGAVLSGSPEIHKTMMQLATTWRLPHPYEVSHGGISYNYRMPNINAALGLAQLERVDTFVEKHLRLHGRYKEATRNIEDVAIVATSNDSQPNHWIQVLELKDGLEGRTISVLKTLTDAGFQARRAWTPIHHMPAFSFAPRAALPETRKAYDSLVCLPSSSQLVDIPGSSLE